MAYFYRRPNGVYYARIRVPDALRAVFGAPDLRRSLHTSDHALASRLALAAAFEWKSEFQRLRKMFDAQKLVSGSPLLKLPGLISLADASAEVGLAVRQLFCELRARRYPLRIRADGWFAAEVASSELVSDDPATPALLDIGETLSGRQLGAVFGELVVRHEALMLAEGDAFDDCVFYRDVGRRLAVVTDLPGVTVDLRALLAQRTDVEVVRNSLAGQVTPEMLDASRQSRFVAEDVNSERITEAVERGMMGDAYKHKSTPVSEMLDAYHSDKMAVWAPATFEQSKRMCALFVELMGNPVMSKINQEMIKAYRLILQRVPLDLHRVRRKHPDVALSNLIELAAKDGVESMSMQRADRYVAKIGEAFVWGVKAKYLKENPADGVASSVKDMHKKKRAQDSRHAFNDELLALIFSQPWFELGRGQQTKRGVYYHFQPFYYWMPLIALYAGARLNEIAQLHLKDIVQSDSGVWYLDFNLEGEGKMDIDEGDDDNSDDGKRLKTVNAVRIVALHPELIRLGLPGYAQALRDAGYSRLFPELSRDEIKGHGKYAGQWFNERFLGKGLKVPRNGTLTFHSFRHTFINACERLEMRERVRNEISGHSRGKGVGDLVYIKDRTADEQFSFLAPLHFNLPPIAAFDVFEGALALQHAMQRKHG
jgi:integrase